MKKVLLIYPFGNSEIYKHSRISAFVPNIPYQSLAILGSVLVKYGVSVKILDLNLVKNPLTKLKKVLQIYSPTYIGISFTTPLFDNVKTIISLIRNLRDNKLSGIKIIIGGPHASALPKRTFEELKPDYLIYGEGEYSFLDVILEQVKKKDICNLVYSLNGCLIQNKKAEMVNINSIPFPLWKLYDLTKYKTNPLNCKQNPIGFLETSRGCPFSCIYCNKDVFGYKFRPKDPYLVAEEIKYMKKTGFNEIQIIDDNFSLDLKRAKKICDLMPKINFVSTGLRADKVDNELFLKMKNKGCYRIYIGIESANQSILNTAKRDMSIKNIKNAIKLANNNGIEVLGLFLLGLPGENRLTIRKTIKFAQNQRLNFIKVGIVKPIPGSNLFCEKKITNWKEMVFHSRDIRTYYNKFYFLFYFNPLYLMRYFFKNLIYMSKLVINFFSFP